MKWFGVILPLALLSLATSMLSHKSQYSKSPLLETGGSRFIFEGQRCNDWGSSLAKFVRLLLVSFEASASVAEKRLH